MTAPYFVRRSRRAVIFEDVVLVALTGYGRDTDVEAAKAAGFDARLTKPADAQLIDEILSGRAHSQKAS